MATWPGPSRAVTLRSRPRRLARVPPCSALKPRRAVSRVLALGAAAVLVGAFASGCSGFNKAFGQREAIVIFREGTAKSVRLDVRSACSHVPRVVPEPLPTDRKLSDYLNNVRYRIDNATDAQLAQLENCLNRFRSVKGVELPQDQNS
jgi:hypothetical protein